MPIGHSANDEADAAARRLITSLDPAAKLRVVDRLVRGVRAMSAAGVRFAHPEWSPAEVDREVARRMIYGEIELGYS